MVEVGPGQDIGIKEKHLSLNISIDTIQRRGVFSMVMV